MNPDLIRSYHAALAGYFGLSPDLAQQPGTTLIERPKRNAHDWHTLFPIGEHIVVPGAPALLDDLRSILAPHAQDHRLRLEDIVVAWGVDRVEADEERFYILDGDAFRPVEPTPPLTVRQLSSADQPAFDAFLAQCDPDEVDTADIEIDHDAAFGVFAGERIVAGASGYAWLGCQDLGVLTDPAYRGRGLGKVVVSAAAAHFLSGERVVFYRHDTSNVGSGRIAQALHFSLVATVYSFRRKTP